MYSKNCSLSRINILLFLLIIVGLVTFSFSATPETTNRTVLAELFTATW